MYGRMLADGRGVAPDLPAAYAWLTRAADSGMADAQVALRAILDGLPARVHSDWGALWTQARQATRPHQEWFIETLRAVIAADCKRYIRYRVGFW